MPSVEKRLESMEEELKLVKGEIKHTLVDLRAVVMQADAPFKEAPRITRRNNELEVHKIQAPASRGELEDPEQGDVAVLAGPATRPPEEVVLPPSEGTPDGGAEKQPEYAGQEHIGPPASLDVNLIASLVRWVCIAQERLGAHRLEGFLDLYIKTTNGSPALKEVITSISTMLGSNEVPQAENPRESDVAQEGNDLMLQLHGILTARCASATIPKTLSPDEIGTECDRLQDPFGRKL